MHSVTNPADVDRFAAISFGRPFTIQDEDWQVEMPGDIDDTPEGEFETHDTKLPRDKNRDPVTTMTYQRLKFKLYQIASPITRDVYFQRDATVSEVVEKVRDIDQRLIEWEKSIPRELRLSSYCTEWQNMQANSVFKILHLQALTLQLSYDNIQLILHRSLLAYEADPHHLRTLDTVSGQFDDLSRPRTSKSRLSLYHNDDIRTSKVRCWKSAMRTSRIGEHPSVLIAARNTHASGYAGLQTFTAGVMLGIFALSNPMSSQAQESKRAISRLIKMPKLLGYRTAISDQCGAILERILRLVLSEEMKSLVSENNSDDEDISSQQKPQVLRSPISPLLNRSARLHTAVQGSDIWSESGDKPARVASVEVGEPYLGPDNIHSVPDYNTTQNAMPDNVPTSTGIDPWDLSGNFNDALHSLQDGKPPSLILACCGENCLIVLILPRNPVFRDSKGYVDTSTRMVPRQQIVGETQPLRTQLPATSESTLPVLDSFVHNVPEASLPGLFSGFEEAGQTWMWDEYSQFP